MSAVIVAEKLSKTYAIYSRPIDRLKQVIWGARKRYFREFVALDQVSFQLKRGEVLGLVGKNGAGKSTLLQMVCGTLAPSSGTLNVQGRVAALLELGAGFNPDFSGKENIYLNAAVLGLSRAEIDEKYAEIVEFSGIGDFIHQPVKSYSSGMFVRLAFAIATSVEPDILVIDEALSVGDGEFARKSFDRIMSLKARGATILFCSHSLFQIESICTQAIWLHQGKMIAQGEPSRIVKEYQAFLDENGAAPQTFSAPALSHQGQIRAIFLNERAFPRTRAPLCLHSLQDDLTIDVVMSADPNFPPPSVAVSFHLPDGRMIASAGSWNDGVTLSHNAQGVGRVRLHFPNIALLKGRYTVSVYLFCERGLHLYQAADHVATLDVVQTGVEQGVVHLVHDWAHEAFEVEKLEPWMRSEWIASVQDSEKLTARTGALDAHNQLLNHEHIELQKLTARTAASLPERLKLCSARMADVGLDTARLGQLVAYIDRPLHEPFDAMILPHETALFERLGGERVSERWQLQRRVRWVPRWLTLNDVEAWCALFSASFNLAARTDIFHWKYGAMPDAAGMAAYCGDTLVAFYGALPRQASLFGEINWVVQIADAMVHPNERGSLSRQGAFFVAASTYIEQTVGFGRFAVCGFGFPVSRALKLAKHLGIYEHVDDMVELSWSSQKRRIWEYFSSRAHWVNTESGKFSAEHEQEIDGLWQKMKESSQNIAICVRDAQFFTHRFLEHPDRPYQIWRITRRFSADVLAFMVLRERGDQGLELIDWVGDWAHIYEIVCAVRHHAARLNYARVFFWCTKSQADRFAALSPILHDLGVGVPANCWSEGFPYERLIGAWWLTGGDTDFR